MIISSNINLIFMSIQHVLISSINFWYLRQLPVVETIAHKCAMHLPISIFSFCTSGNFIFFAWPAVSLHKNWGFRYMDISFSFFKNFWSLDSFASQPYTLLPLHYLWQTWVCSICKLSPFRFHICEKSCFFLSLPGETRSARAEQYLDD